MKPHGAAYKLKKTTYKSYSKETVVQKSDHPLNEYFSAPRLRKMGHVAADKSGLLKPDYRIYKGVLTRS